MTNYLPAVLDVNHLLNQEYFLFSLTGHSPGALAAYSVVSVIATFSA